MSEVSTHVLDTSRGEPASGIVVRLERVSGSVGHDEAGTEPGEAGTEPGEAITGPGEAITGPGEAITGPGPVITELGRAVTDADGRIAGFGAALPAGTYRLTFQTAAYLRAAAGGAEPFFPEVIVTFTTDGLRPRYHVPLLLSPYSYSTYRGS